MAYFLLVVHIATAIVFIGALTISVSLFPRYAAAAPDVDDKSHDAHPVALAMHRITKVYGRLAIIPPAVGITLAVVLGRLDELWISHRRRRQHPRRSCARRHSLDSVPLRSSSGIRAHTRQPPSTGPASNSPP